MEVHFTVFVVTLQDHPFAPSVFAYVAVEALSIFIDNSRDLSLFFVKILDFWDPVDAGRMEPSQIRFFNHALKILACHAFNFLWLQLFLINFPTPHAKPAI